MPLHGINVMGFIKPLIYARNTNISNEAHFPPECMITWVQGKNCLYDTNSVLDGIA